MFINPENEVFPSPCVFYILQNTMKEILRFTLPLVCIATGYLTLTPAAQAQYAQHQGTYSTPKVLVPRVSPYPQVYTPNYRYKGISHGRDSVVIVQPRSRSRSVIIVPANANITVISTPSNSVNNVIINTSPSPQCGSAVLGSPIPSPVPVNLYTGQPCNWR